ncbi:DUF4292 domain-containing protein [Apibacter muscae]|uniref:DUF4292 domain-containing protein n=1 Tax=Apibacter muscae TaxID=2509004 RepID=UPI0011AD9CDE|nr:DUF4292 domain-containing protein [Apibacter muscae]TWP24032.1 DUF4292 domain-containing protein [Apibacter muscae]
MKYIIYFALLTILFSCNTQKVSTEQTNKINFESVNEKRVFDNINSSLEFKNLKIKANANIKVGETSYPSVSLVLYLDRYKEIWGNASLILPLARVSITPEAFKLYEKIGKSYIDTDFKYINSLLNVDFLDYSSIENLLTGKMFLTITPKDYKFSIEKNQFILQSIKDIRVGEGKNIRNYKVKISLDSNYNLKEVKMEDKKYNSLIEVSYGEYLLFENLKFPKNIKIILKDQKEASITLEYNKFESVKMETPFDIPKGYTQRKIN